MLFDGDEAMLLRVSSTTSDLMPSGDDVASFFSVTTRLRFLAGGLATSSISWISSLISVLFVAYANRARADRVVLRGGEVASTARSNSFAASLEALDALILGE